MFKITKRTKGQHHSEHDETITKEVRTYGCLVLLTATGSRPWPPRRSTRSDASLKRSSSSVSMGPKTTTEAAWLGL